MGIDTQDELVRLYHAIQGVDAVVNIMFLGPC